MAMNTVRLMSPTRRRIVELNPAAARDKLADEQLRKIFGWMDYLGPGDTDALGFFDPESDPSIEPPMPYETR